MYGTMQPNFEDVRWHFDKFAQGVGKVTNVSVSKRIVFVFANPIGWTRNVDIFKWEAIK